MDSLKKRVAELEQLEVPQTKRPDFDAFWAEQVQEARTVPLHVKGRRVDYPIPGWDARDLTFEGLDGTPVRTWVLLPPQAREGRVPAVVAYHGAGGSRGTPAMHAPWLALGCAVVALDFRMQGGLTGSNTGFTAAGDLGLFNLGLPDKRQSYFRHVWTDCLRAIEVALATEEIDGARVAVEGGSQGGAASLAMAALHPAVALCCADVPSNCWLEKRAWDGSGGAAKIASFLREHPEQVDAACETLSYFDNLNLAERIRCPVLVSVGLKDPICPPDNVYAAYNRIRAPKEIAVYPFGDHGGGGLAHLDRKLAFVRRNLLQA